MVQAACKVGALLGVLLGAADGIDDGCALGALLGVLLGNADGIDVLLGSTDGVLVGAADGVSVSPSLVGDADGTGDGRTLGALLGVLLGVADGIGAPDVRHSSHPVLCTELSAAQDICSPEVTDTPEGPVVPL